MSQKVRKLVSVAAILFILWLLWSRLYIVIWVHVPWWGLLMIAAAIFLGIDYMISQVFD